MQIEVLKQLLNMPPAVRNVALAACLSPQVNPATLWRSPSMGSSSSQDKDSDKESVASQDSRIHHTGDEVNKLAKHISKTYFAAEEIWDHLYIKNRVDEKRFEKILTQVKGKLTAKQRRVFKNNRTRLKSKLKKKIAADRRYRTKIKSKEQKKKLIAPLAHEIDLTLSGDEKAGDSDGSAAGDCGDEKAGDSDSSTAGDSGGSAAGDCGDEKAGDSDGGADGDGDKKDDPKKNDEADDSDGGQDNNRKARAEEFINKLEKIRLQKQKEKEKRAELKKKEKEKRAEQKKLAQQKKKEKEKEKRAKTTRGSKRRTRANPDTQTTPRKKKSKTDTPTTPTESPSRWKDRPMIASFKVGSKVSGMWKGPACKGDWYDGKVLSINDKDQTAHVMYNDGDQDTDLPWSNMRLL